MNTRSFPFAFGLVALMAANALAEEPAELKTAGYHLKNKSSFIASQTVRAPFWPIGWTPSAKGSNQHDAPVQEFTLKPDQFSVTSILLGSQSLAVINGRTYGEGEYLRMGRLGGARPVAGAPAAPAAAPTSSLPLGAKIRVARIADGQVILQCGTQAIAVPLRRQQLSEKKPGEDDLLLQAQAER